MQGFNGSIVEAQAWVNLPRDEGLKKVKPYPKAAFYGVPCGKEGPKVYDKWEDVRFL